MCTSHFEFQLFVVIFLSHISTSTGFLSWGAKGDRPGDWGDFVIGPHIQFSLNFRISPLARVFPHLILRRIHFLTVCSRLDGKLSIFCIIGYEATEYRVMGFEFIIKLLIWIHRLRRFALQAFACLTFHDWIKPSTTLVLPPLLPPFLVPISWLQFSHLDVTGSGDSQVYFQIRFRRSCCEITRRRWRHTVSPAKSTAGSRWERYQHVSERVNVIIAERNSSWSSWPWSLILL